MSDITLRNDLVSGNPEFDPLMEYITNISKDSVTFHIPRWIWHKINIDEEKIEKLRKEFNIEIENQLDRIRTYSEPCITYIHGHFIILTLQRKT